MRDVKLNLLDKFGVNKCNSNRVMSDKLNLRW